MIMKALALALGVALGTASVAQEAEAPATAKVSPSHSLNKDRADKGWFWYEDPVAPAKEAKKKEPAPPPKKDTSPPAKTEDPCSKMETWTASCGFVNPGTSFEFQAKQRDALLENMTMNPGNPKAVEAFQYYTKWMMERATSVANMWYYNMVQNPDLDPQTKAPISTFGLKLMTDVKDASSSEIFKALKEEGALVYFSRSDCTFCHSMTPIVLRIAQATGMEVWNASLDSKCMEGFKLCRTEKVTTGPAQALQVTTVPTLFLYVKPNTWIRVAVGVSDDETIKARIVSFFSAYRQALAKGMNPTAENGRANVDFSYELPTGTTKGVTSKDNGQKVPSQREIDSILGK